MMSGILKKKNDSRLVFQSVQLIASPDKRFEDVRSHLFLGKFDYMDQEVRTYSNARSVSI